MTEDQAKQKWCPFARDSNTGGNRLRFGGAVADVAQYGKEAASEFPCIGSACMAWRWDSDAKVSAPMADIDAYAAKSKLDRKGAIQEMAKSLRPGYCGLAGATP